MNHEEFARRIETVRKKLYKTAFLYLGNETLALDAVDETVYKALCSYKKLRELDYFDTWITRILINECYNEQRRQKRFGRFEELPETAVEAFDSLPLKEAIKKLIQNLFFYTKIIRQNYLTFLRLMHRRYRHLSIHEVQLLLQRH